MSAAPSQVVVAFNFSHSANVALRRAIVLASPLHALHFVCVIDPHTSIPVIEASDGIDRTAPPFGGAAGRAQVPAVDDRYAARVQQALAAVVECELIDADVTQRVTFYVHARIGKPASEILAVASEVGAELIIVGSKGITGVERMLVGSVAERIVREARCTVEVARTCTYDHVDPETLVEIEPDRTYIAPRRYTYESHRLAQPSHEWPLR